MHDRYNVCEIDHDQDPWIVMIQAQIEVCPDLEPAAVLMDIAGELHAAFVRRQGVHAIRVHAIEGQTLFDGGGSRGLYIERMPADWDEEGQHDE